MAFAGMMCPRDRKAGQNLASTDQFGTWSRVGRRPLLADATGYCAAFALVAGFLAIFWGITLNYDTAWFLIATRKWLGGAALYSDLMELNPPLMFYLTAPAIWIADLTGMTDSNAQLTFVALLMFASLSWCFRLLADRQGLAPRRRVLLLCAIAAALIIPTLRGFGGVDVAQREQTMLILLMPWVIGLLVWQDPDAGPGAPLRAAVAAIGLCLKPYFLLLPLAVTLWQVLNARSLRPVLSRSNRIIGLAGLLYILAAWWLHPAYFTDIVPMAGRYYGAVSLGGMRMLTAVNSLATVLLLFALLPAVWSRRGGRSTAILLVLICAALGIYLVQWKGFGYHLMPFEAFGILAAGWLIATPAGGKGASALAVLVLLSAVAHDVKFLRSHHAVMGPLIPYAQSLGGRPRIAVISTTIAAGPPLALASGADWVGRYPVMWQMPGVVNTLHAADCADEPAYCAALRSTRDRVRDEVVTDLVEGAPDMLILDTSRWLLADPSFQWERFLSGDPRFSQVRARLPVRTDIPGFTILTARPLAP